MRLPEQKKTVQKSESLDTVTTVITKPDTVSTVVVPRPPVKKTVEPTPKVITVSDVAARKTIDGRLYYDLMGHRYWRNNKDGKYYLYNKSMQTDPAFKNP